MYDVSYIYYYVCNSALHGKTFSREVCPPSHSEPALKYKFHLANSTSSPPAQFFPKLTSYFSPSARRAALLPGFRKPGHCLHLEIILARSGSKMSWHPGHLSSRPFGRDHTQYVAEGGTFCPSTKERTVRRRLREGTGRKGKPRGWRTAALA